MMILDGDIASMYPNIIAVQAKPYRYVTFDDHIWYVVGNTVVNEWITASLPNVVEDQGSLVLNESEFMMLVLKFGPGKEIRHYDPS